MAVNTQMEVSFWEKLGDQFSALGEGFGRFLTRLFGDSNERYIRSLGYTAPTRPTEVPQIAEGSLLAQVNALEERTRALSDEELKGLTVQFRERLAAGESLDDLLPEAFAACREAGRRTKNMRHFDVQILGGIVLHRGNIAEMVTGEGKTLVATLPAYLNALVGKGVHVITVNDYLARRDCEWMLPIYRALGLTAGYIQSDMDPVARRLAYECDITYGTNSEFGFDYLRDNMKPARWGDPNFSPYHHQCQRGLHYAIIDEVDNILIDEARTPLIISGQAFSDVKRYAQANDIAVKLTELEKKKRTELVGKPLATQEGEELDLARAPLALTEEEDDTSASTALRSLLAGKNEKEAERTGYYFEIKEKEHTCHLTEAGIRKAEELAGVESFYTAGNMEWPHLIDNALRAHHLYKKDKNYAVMRHPETNEMSIIIIDEFTGRLMIGRQWSDGLHQAVEAKHARDGVKIKEETQTLATITLQNFFKLYKKLAGMTGTAMTESEEFYKIYKLKVIAIPTNKPLIRVNHPDVIYRSEREKWQAVVNEVVDVHKEGRPILIGTTDVAKSIKLSEMLKRRGVKHELLNALPEHAARESEIVAQAGRIGAVTIATNMAGRGTDIILGGNPETMAWSIFKHKYASRLDVPEDEWKALVDDIEHKEQMKVEGRKVAEMGGLHIIGTERHESRRIDNQLRGRAGRQGDPGSSRFYIALEDDLMRIFGGDRVRNLLEWMGMQEGENIENAMVSRQIEKAQKRVEERHFESRRNLLEYDEVMDRQRTRIYGFRQQILEGANCKIRILEMIDEQIQKAVARFLDGDYGAATFAEFAANRLGMEFEAADFARSTYEEAVTVARDMASRNTQTQVQEMLEENLGAEDEKEWNWQALSGQAAARWGIKASDRDLRRIGKDNLAAYLIQHAERSIEQVDLSEGRPYLDPDWGLISLCDWARRKFLLKLTPKDLKNLSEEQLATKLHDLVNEVYYQKEIAFPVEVAMASFMADRGEARMPGQQRYDREGLFFWAKQRFPGKADKLVEDDFRTHSRAKLQAMLLEISKQCYAPLRQSEIDKQLEETFAHAETAEPEDAKELVQWAQSKLDLKLAEENLVGLTPDQARHLLWNSYDERYRPEMHRMERSLLLHQVDSSWKNHLYTMDHLRSGIGLVSYAQVDPKTEYKRLGMKEFEAMWENAQDKVTDAVFRMEEAEDFQESLWTIGATIHEAAPRVTAAPTGEQEMSTNSSEGAKKIEPIRNRGEKVGRNDPCPCGSGKKYKNCHMRQQAAS